ncbi:MAG: uroporphyrinogen-III C-methyltransferase [Betaproteobacteria bacterium]|jgi:uroporphyrin-3 C-methyltransferase|nr:uroporphyrinogen-III C-methyltransferase [Betaproteobacteria bacterium]MDH4292455.1 uroporphyrinogen-III C-methyltransferase [Betaproteobacteria bacterium]MDH5341436.1 uroporphyrinogen-III C-methyltransferase [Betaproteobacteria bacterium]
MSEERTEPAGVSETAGGTAAESDGPAAAPRESKPGGSALAALALIVALAAAGAAAYQWYHDRGAGEALRHELAKRLADMEAQNKDAVARASQASAALREAEVKLGVLESKLAESQNQQIALEALHQELSRNRDEWAFVDIEQSILLASQQLQIAANVRAALIGLENAEARLQRMDQPRYTALRRTLARDIERLKSLPLADVYATSVRLDDVIAGIDKLPLAMDARARAEAVAAPPVAADMPDWERVLREAWRELRQLVRVQTSNLPDAVLLPPDQVFFLRENLKLRLLGARISLLSRDAKSFQRDLNLALAALERHFDANDGGVTAVAASLRKLQSAQVQVDMPDLTETLETLRKLRLPRPKGSG